MLPEKIRCLIIDGNPSTLKLLWNKLDQSFPDVEVVNIAYSGAEGLQKIAVCRPDLIFLNAKMNDMTGFEMLSWFKDIHFQTIFISSLSHFDINAIRFNALDYLVQPIGLGELQQAIKRYKLNKSPNNAQKYLPPSCKNKVINQKLLLNTQEGELRLLLKNIVRIEAQRTYSWIHLANCKKRLTSKNLGYLDSLLKNKGFFRCHKSHLINFAHIQSDPFQIPIILSDGNEIPVSRRKQVDFAYWYESYQSQLTSSFHVSK